MRLFSIVIVLAAVIALAGCGTPIQPVISAAGMVKTAYDYHEWLNPPERVDFYGQAADDQNIEYSIRKNIHEEGVKYQSIAAYSFEGHVYLVGVFEDAKDAERARAIAKNTMGVRRLTCSFFRPDTPAPRRPSNNNQIAQVLSQKIQADQELSQSWVRISVQQESAVIMGRVASPELKHRFESIVRDTKGLREMRSYLAVRS